MVKIESKLIPIETWFENAIDPWWKDNYKKKD